MKQIIEEVIRNAQSVADVNTVVGEPVTLPNGVTVVPFSKVSVGFTAGGADRKPKDPKDPQVPLFAGGSGAGVSVQPLGFLVVSADGSVTLLDLKNPDSYAPRPNPVDRAIDGAQSLMDRAPDLLTRCKDLFGRKKDQPAPEEPQKD